MKPNKHYPHVNPFNEKQNTYHELTFQENKNFIYLQNQAKTQKEWQDLKSKINTDERKQFKQNTYQWDAMDKSTLFKHHTPQMDLQTHKDCHDQPRTGLNNDYSRNKSNQYADNAMRDTHNLPFEARFSNISKISHQIDGLLQFFNKQKHDQKLSFDRTLSAKQQKHYEKNYDRNHQNGCSNKKNDKSNERNRLNIQNRKLVNNEYLNHRRNQKMLTQGYDAHDMASKSQKYSQIGTPCKRNRYFQRQQQWEYNESHQHKQKQQPKLIREEKKCDRETYKLQGMRERRRIQQSRGAHQRVNQDRAIRQKSLLLQRKTRQQKKQGGQRKQAYRKNGVQQWNGIRVSDEKRSTDLGIRAQLLRQIQQKRAAWQRRGLQQKGRIHQRKRSKQKIEIQQKRAKNQNIQRNQRVYPQRRAFQKLQREKHVKKQQIRGQYPLQYSNKHIFYQDSHNRHHNKHNISQRIYYERGSTMGEKKDIKCAHNRSSYLEYRGYRNQPYQDRQQHQTPQKNQAKKRLYDIQESPQSSLKCRQKQDNFENAKRPFILPANQLPSSRIQLPSGRKNLPSDRTQQLTSGKRAQLSSHRGDLYSDRKEKQNSNRKQRLPSGRLPPSGKKEQLPSQRKEQLRLSRKEQPTSGKKEQICLDRKYQGPSNGKGQGKQTINQINKTGLNSSQLIKPNMSEAVKLIDEQISRVRQQITTSEQRNKQMKYKCKNAIEEGKRQNQFSKKFIQGTERMGTFRQTGLNNKNKDNDNNHTFGDKIIKNNEKPIFSMSENKPTICELAKALCIQIETDKQMKPVRKAYTNLNKDAKWQILSNKLTDKGIQHSPFYLQQMLEVCSEQEDPFTVNQSPPINLSEEMVLKYTEAHIQWQGLRNSIDVNELEKEGFKVESMDLNSKGYLNVEDVVSFANLYSGSFYRNRDAICLYKRLLFEQQQGNCVEYETWLNFIQKV